MFTPEFKLENNCQELQQDIYRYFARLSEAEEFCKKKSAASSQRVKALQAQMWQAQEREAQLNNEWVPVEAAREQLLRKIYQNLLNENAICQKFERQITQPVQRTNEDKSEGSVAAFYDQVFHEQALAHSKI